MIFDVSETSKFDIYKSRPGPFCIVFYDDKNEENKKFYYHLKNELKKFPELPFLRFHFNFFKLLFPLEKVTYSNQILIIEKGKEGIIKEIQDYSKIIYALKNIQKIVLEKKKKGNIGYHHRKKAVAWAPNGHHLKYEEFLKIDEESADSLYNFPNKTALIPIPQKKYIPHTMTLPRPSKAKQKAENSLKRIKESCEIIVKSKKNNKPKISPQLNVLTSIITPIKIVYNPQIIILPNITNNLINNISKSPPKIQSPVLNIDEPLDLSLPKISKHRINPQSNQQYNIKPLNLTNRPNFKENNTTTTQPKFLPKLINNQKRNTLFNQYIH